MRGGGGPDWNTVTTSLIGNQEARLQLGVFNRQQGRGGGPATKTLLTTSNIWPASPQASLSRAIRARTVRFGAEPWLECTITHHGCMHTLHRRSGTTPPTIPPPASMNLQWADLWATLLNHTLGRWTPRCCVQWWCLDYRGIDAVHLLLHCFLRQSGLQMKGLLRFYCPHLHMFRILHRHDYCPWSCGHYYTWGLHMNKWEIEKSKWPFERSTSLIQTLNTVRFSY